MRLYKVVPGSSEGPGPVPPSCQPRTKPHHSQDRKPGSSSAGTCTSLPLTQPLLLLCLPELLREPSQEGGSRSGKEIMKTLPSRRFLFPPTGRVKQRGSTGQAARLGQPHRSPCRSTEKGPAAPSPKHPARAHPLPNPAEDPPPAQLQACRPPRPRGVDTTALLKPSTSHFCPPGDAGPAPDPGPVHSSAAGGTGSVAPLPEVQHSSTSRQ